MRTLCEFCGSALVIFYGQDSPRRDCSDADCYYAYARDKYSLARGFKPTELRVAIPTVPLYSAPAKEYAPPPEYMKMEDFLRHANRVVDTTVDDPIDPPPHVVDICQPVAI